MGFEIVWTPKAVATFSERISYLQTNWSEREIFDFTARVNEFLEVIKKQPFIFRKSQKIRNTYVSFIIKEVSIIYRVKEDQEKIEIITFLHNRQKQKAKH